MAPIADQNILLFYKYFTPPLTKTNSVDNLVEWQKKLTSKLCLSGRVLISEQGVNGTVAGSMSNCDAYTNAVEQFELSGRLLFENIHWKRSFVCESMSPFPDLRVKRVKELVASGGTLNVDVSECGTHLEPTEFHNILANAKPDDDLVVLDVRNRWEYDVGHFTDAASRPAINPNMRNFTQFRQFIDDKTELFKDKRVLMYCTGGIRCETASSYLISKGIATSVSQLSGGIHTYCEEMSAIATEIGQEQNLEKNRDDGGKTILKKNEKQKNLHSNTNSNNPGFFHGQNFVFDKRAVVPSGTGISVGKCSECFCDWEKFSGACVCTVCVCPVLVCENCRKGVLSNADNADLQPLRQEWFCLEHSHLRGIFFEFLDGFDSTELIRQQSALKICLSELEEKLGPLSSKVRNGNVKGWKDNDTRQRRRTIVKQLRRIELRLKEVNSGAIVEYKYRCRSCRSFSCVDGKCWGFWNVAKKTRKI